MSRLLIVGSIAILVLIAGIVLWRGMDPSPAPLPDGATPLSLRTQPPSWQFPFMPRACSIAALSPVRLVREEHALVFESVETGQRVPVLFPYGFGGRLVSARAELVAPEGVVLAREGSVLTGLGGASADNGDFLVCFTGPIDYPQVAEP